MDRRTFLRTAPAVGLAIATPVAAGAQLEPIERIRQAVADLHALMGEYMAGQPDSWSVFLVGNRPSGKKDIVIATRGNGETDLLGTRPQRDVVKTYIDDGSPLRADDVTGTTDYANWERRKA
jgi:hypothetical protein